MKKLINELLKNPKTGQWSRKNTAGFLCMAYAMCYSTYGLVRDKPAQEFVVATFVGASLACLGISSWEKANVNNEIK